MRQDDFRSGFSKKSERGRFKNQKLNVIKESEHFKAQSPRDKTSLVERNSTHSRASPDPKTQQRDGRETSSQINRGIVQQGEIVSSRKGGEILSASLRKRAREYHVLSITVPKEHLVWREGQKKNTGGKLEERTRHSE